MSIKIQVSGELLTDLYVGRNHPFSTPCDNAQHTGDCKVDKEGPGDLGTSFRLTTDWLLEWSKLLITLLLDDLIHIMLPVNLGDPRNIILEDL